MSTWPSAIRRGSIMAALLAVGVWVGSPEAGIAATTGALNVALLDAAVDRAVLARALWLCLATTTLVGFVAVLLGGSWWLIPFLGVLAFLQGASAAAGVAVANATIASMITAILLSLTPGGVQHAATLAAWLFVGALIEVVIALLAWHWERQGLVRRQVAMALRARSDQLQGAADERTVQRWIAAACVTASTAGLSQAERSAVDRILERALLTQDPMELRGAARRLRRLPGSSVAGDLGDLLSQFERATAPSQPAASSLSQRWAGWRADLAPLSTSAGIRLAVLMMLGATVVQVLGLPQGHWVLLVFALAVRCDYSGTVATLVARAVGVTAGVVAVTALVFLSGGAVGALLIVALVAGILTCRWLLGNPTMFFLFLTMFVTVLVDVWAPTTALGDDRVVATLVGVAIGLVVSVLWPGWRGSDTESPVRRQPLT